VALLFVLFHSITWFNLAPKAMVVRWKGHRVPDGLVAGANYAAWLALSAAVAFFLLRG
jgi:fumarate reductase subunit C